jgi:hypothetical protein
MMLQTPTLGTRQDRMQGCVPFQNCRTSNKDTKRSKLYTVCSYLLYANVKIQSQDSIF